MFTHFYDHLYILSIFCVRDAHIIYLVICTASAGRSASGWQSTRPQVMSSLEIVIALGLGLVLWLALEQELL